MDDSGEPLISLLETESLILSPSLSCSCAAMMHAQVRSEVCFERSIAEHLIPPRNGRGWGSTEALC